VTKRGLAPAKKETDSEEKKGLEGAGEDWGKVEALKAKKKR